MADNIKKHSFKIQVGTAIVVLLFCVGTTYKVTKAFNDVEKSIEHIKGKTDLYNERYDEMERRVDTTELNYVEIKTKLLNIETLLMEMKQRIY